ncbi:MAG: PRD domain-containing protein [Lachnospiraceae bacterium]|jgi:transcriptional regulatory protein LevR/transcriptional regulator with AAA-type ATPase domain|nr:PRD domain-containing protein [Lachnospiraceae bacterium]
MKSKKEILYEYMLSSGGGTAEKSFTTQELSQKLEMQRSNLSTLLNELVKEGRLEKLAGRPVLYRMSEAPESIRRERSCFGRLIGQEGSLKHMVQLAKAAILYPEHSLHTLIMGPEGSGKSYFASLMAEFARENGVIAQDAPFAKFNCRYYEGMEKELNEQLFGDGTWKEGAFQKAKGGVLFIDHINFLPAYSRDILLDMIENEKKEARETIVICAADDSERKHMMEAMASRFSVRIDLPSLQARSLEERFALVQRFFIEEAARMNKAIRVNAELLRCILLYRCERNVKQLRSDVRMGCANAYVREFNRKTRELCIYLNDFSPQVRKGFLYYRDERDKVESLIPQNYSYTFSGENMEKVEDENFIAGEPGETIYDFIDRKVSELRERGILEEDISTIINADLEYDLKQVTNRLCEGNINKESILKIVDQRIVVMVEQFMQKASKRFERVFPESTFYGLCLHLSAALERSDRPQRLSNDRIMEIVEKYREEYAFCTKFSAMLEKEFEVQLPIDEVVFITMFLCGGAYGRPVSKLVVLVAMHGNSTATSMAETVNSLVKCGNTYAFNLSLDKDMQSVYEELRKMVQEIDEGKGILMLYDMGSLKTMAETVMKETGIYIRTMMVPATLIVLDCSRKAGSFTTIDELYDNMMETYRTSYMQMTEEYQRQNNHKVIVTLCQSGKGGAVQMKNYLERHLSLEGVDIIPLAISDRRFLLEEINKIKKDHEILYVIGTYDPKLHGIAFISIARLFETPVDKLDILLTLESLEQPRTVDFEAMAAYLSEQLEGIDVDALNRLLPRAITRIKKTVQGLSQDQELGLYMHIACTVYRIITRENMPGNINRENILMRHKRLYNDLKDILKPLEEEFDIVFGDDEMANIISIIKQL